MLGLRCCRRPFSSCGERGYSWTGSRTVTVHELVMVGTLDWTQQLPDCGGLNCVLLDSLAEALTFIVTDLEIKLLGCKLVEWAHKVSPNQIALVTSREEKAVSLSPLTEERSCEFTARKQPSTNQEESSYQNLTLPMPWCWTSCLFLPLSHQKCERINFSCLTTQSTVFGYGSISKLWRDWF